MSKKRHLEAGQVLLEYAKDVRQAVIAFVEGGHFSEGRRVVSDFVRIRLNPHSRRNALDNNECSTRACRGHCSPCSTGM